MELSTAAAFMTIDTTWRGYDNQTDAPTDGGSEPGWTLPPWVATVKALLKMRLGICYVALFCNTLVLLIQMKLRSFQKTQYIFAVTLVISDLVLTACTFGETHRYIHNRQPIPLVYNGLYLSSNMMSWLSVIGMGVDRYLALVKIPLTYKFSVTMKKYIFVIVALVTWSALYAYFSTIYTNRSDAIAQYRRAVVLGSCLVISTALYLVIALSIRKSLRSMSLDDRAQNLRLQQTRRLTVAFSLIIITNAICFLPSLFSFMTIYFRYQGQGYYMPRNIIILNATLTIRALNLVFNPVIYWWKILFREIAFPCRQKELGGSSTEMATISNVGRTASNQTCSA